MQKLLKAQCFMNKMHEYEMKSFSKTFEFNLSSKNKILNHFVPNSQTLNIFCIKIKRFLILDGHNKITDNNVYKV